MRKASVLLLLCGGILLHALPIHNPEDPKDVSKELGQLLARDSFIDLRTQKTVPSPLIRSDSLNIVFFLDNADRQERATMTILQSLIDHHLSSKRPVREIWLITGKSDESAKTLFESLPPSLQAYTYASESTDRHLTSVPRPTVFYFHGTDYITSTPLHLVSADVIQSTAEDLLDVYAPTE